MDWAALFHLFQSWGPTAISSLLVIVVMHLIRKVDENSKEEMERSENLKGCLDVKIKELREDTTKVLNEHRQKLSYIELEYVRRESFYRELGGWKDDINRLSGQITDYTKNIIELWKDKRGP